jgi:hypothetical protein
MQSGKILRRNLRRGESVLSKNYRFRPAGKFIIIEPVCEVKRPGGGH